MLKRPSISLIVAATAGLIAVQSCPAQESWTTYSTSNTPAFTENNTFYSVAFDRNRNVWVGNRPTTSGGTGTIYKFNGTEWVKVLDIAGGDKIWTIFVDSRNSVWVGTAGKGVYKYDGTRWVNFRSDVNKTDGVDSLGGDWVKHIGEDAAGNIWFACGPPTSPLTDDYSTPGVGGLTKLETSTSKFTKYLSDFNGSYVGGGNCALANNWVVAVAFDAAGNVWAGTKGSGVSKFNPTTKTWTTYTTDNGLSNNTVNPGGLHYAPSTGRMWAGTLNGASWTVDGSSWTSITEINTYRVWSIVSDWEGKVWLSAPDPATDPKGLVRYDANGTTQIGLWNNITGLVDNILRRIAIDDNTGKVWCATNSGITVLSGVLPPKPTTAVEKEIADSPETFEVAQNYPNPFNPQTTIEYALLKPQKILLTICNINGQLIRVLESGFRTAGRHVVRWDGRDQGGTAVSSGSYIYQLVTEDGRRLVKKALLLR